MSTITSTGQDRERVNPPTSDLTADDMFESLTGFDEIAVRQKFDRPVHEISQVDPLQFMRALVYVDQRRRGLKDPEAYKAAQGLTLAQVDDYFTTPEPEIDPEDPVTDQGKGDGSTGRSPSS